MSVVLKQMLGKLVLVGVLGAILAGCTVYAPPARLAYREPGPLIFVHPWR